MNPRARVKLYRRLLRRAETQLRRRTAAPLDQAIQSVARDVEQLFRYVDQQQDPGGPVTDLIEYELAGRNLKRAHDQLMLAYDAVVPQTAGRRAAVHTIEGPASDNVQKAIKLLHEIKTEARLRHWDPEIAQRTWDIIGQTEYLLELVEAAETTPRTFGRD